MKVGGTASITAITQIITMVLMGFLVGQWMGWKQMDSIFGVILSISSTTIILKTFELGVKAQKFAGIVIGSLIVQDIVAI
jgi:CPA2 family monovalent cation:H+ antiporter-2